MNNGSMARAWLIAGNFVLIVLTLFESTREPLVKEVYPILTGVFLVSGLASLIVGAKGSTVATILWGPVVPILIALNFSGALKTGAMFSAEFLIGVAIFEMVGFRFIPKRPKPRHTLRV